MTRFDRRLLTLALRQDLSSFTQRCFHTVAPAAAYRHNWHIDAVAWHLQQCLVGAIKRLIIMVPPRNGKSICASVALPAFALGHDPTLPIVCASYANELTGKHARDCRRVIESAWYRQVFPGTRLDPTKNTELEFTTTRGGVRLGTSVGGTLTGRGGNLIIIDDPLKPSEAMSEVRRAAVKEWYDQTLFSRLNDKAADVIVLVMQRLHVDDLVGHVLDKPNGRDWVQLSLPAIADAAQSIPIGEDDVYERAAGALLHPDREPQRVLDEAKETLGGAAFSAQYQQAPVPLGGGLIRWDWFRSYREPPPIEPGDQRVQSWDTAAKAGELNDYSACTTWLVKKNLYFLLDVTRRRLEYPYLKKLVVAHAGAHRADTVLIEDKGSGTQLIQDLRADRALAPIAVAPEGDKLTRMSAQSAKIEAGRVLLPERAGWLADFQAEVLAFPNGRHDDQVDSLSQFLGWITNRPTLQVFV